MSKKLILVLIIAIIATSMYISFQQYLHTAIDGDIVPIVLPMESYNIVFHDPIGLKAILENQHYSGAGRYFIHLTLYFIFHQGFSFVNKILNDPIESLFVTAAIFQWVCHLLLSFVIALYVNIGRKFSFLFFLGSITLSIPFYQYANGAFNTALIDSAVTYTAFYAFPLGLLLLFYYPVFRQVFFESSNSISLVGLIGMVILGTFLIFSGPLIPVLGILLGSLAIFFSLLRNKKTSVWFNLRDLFRNLKSLDLKIKFIVPLFMILWFYDFYLGKYNSENDISTSILKRYEIMFSYFSHYFLDGNLPFFFSLAAINLLFIKVFHPYYLKSRNFRYLVIFGIAALLFVLLLPLGGYRVYRPTILRYDVTMPLTVYLIVVIESGILLLMNSLKPKYKIIYYPIVSVLLAILVSKNLGKHDNIGTEQRSMLTILRNSSGDSTICLPYSSNFFAWEKIDVPEKSNYVSQMLFNWGIIKRQIPFYQK